MTARELIIDYEQRWEAVAREALGADARLLSVSRHIGDSRAYAAGGRVGLIRAIGTPPPPGVRGLASEAILLERLGRSAEHRVVDGFEVLVVERLPGQPLEQLVPSMTVARRVRILAATVRELRRVHAHGVAHRDLRTDNVLVDGGRVHLIDFDRAGAAPPAEAAVADWIGVSGGGVSFYPFWKLALFVLAPKTETFARRARSAVTSLGRGLPSVPAGDEQLETLRQAWLRAQQSKANAPGQGVAYYAFTFRAHHFPGERPWYLRWEAIRRAVDFRGKNLVELGSNMGLLSTFAVLHGGQSARGVDGDEAIVEAANLVARALDAPATFRKVDLLSDENWESTLAGGDIVAAMSLLHWLPDPTRLLDFLRGHDEVIFEGHDPLDIERSRLRDLGFQHVDVVQQTERGRFVLHARR